MIFTVVFFNEWKASPDLGTVGRSKVRLSWVYGPSMSLLKTHLIFTSLTKALAETWTLRRGMTDEWRILKNYFEKEHFQMAFQWCQVLLKSTQCYKQSLKWSHAHRGELPERRYSDTVVFWRNSGRFPMWWRKATDGRP